MDSKQLLSKISVNQIVYLLSEYYGVEFEEEGNVYKFRTFCHHKEDYNEGNFKLYFYKDSKTFFCYSSCGFMDLISLIQEVEETDFQGAMEFLQSFFHIGEITRGFGRPKEEVEFIKQSKIHVRKEIDFNEKLPIYDEYILNTFIKYHAVEWLSEGISDETMDKYEISFDMESNGIIIPHRDIDNNLVGIRQRNLDVRQVEKLGRKYVPYTNFRSKITYRHKLGKNLYGLNINKDCIRESKKCILWESEKSVLKMDSIYSSNPSVAVGGSAVNEYQLNLLKQLGCENIYLAFDNEIDEKWDKKLKKICDRIIDFGLNCYIVDNEDMCKYLNEKESMIDRGQEVFEKLLKKYYKYEKVV